MRKLVYILLMLSCMLFIVYLEHQILLREKLIRQQDTELASKAPVPVISENRSSPRRAPGKDVEPTVKENDSLLAGMIHEQGISRQEDGRYFEAVWLFETVATRFSNHGLAEDSVIRIAFCWTALGMSDFAAHTLTYFVYRYPDSKHTPEIRTLLLNRVDNDKTVA